MDDASSPRAPGPLGRGYLEVTLSVLALVTIVAFESMAVSTAMPTVARELDAVRSYGFAFSVMLTAQLLGIVLAGVWSDRSGPLVGAVTGQALLATGSAVCGFASTLPVFLAGRALTGLGGGLLVVMLYVIAGRFYPESIRPRLFTYVSAAWVLPSLLGAPVSAWLTTHLSWRWVFWGVVPPVLVTMAALAHARRRVDAASLSVAVSGRDHAAHVRAAWAGVGIALAAGAVQVGTHELVLDLSPRTGLALAGLVGVVLVAPLLVPRGTWRMARGLPSVMLSRALLTGAFYAGVTYVPLFLVGQRGLSLQTAGLSLAVGAVGWAAGAWYQGHDTLHLPRYRLVEIGGALLAAGFAVVAVVAGFGLPWWLVPLALVLTGVAMGLGVTTTTVLSLELSPVEEHGEASSSLQLADVLGSVLGIAAATALFAARHVPGRDDALFAAIFLGLAAGAAVVVPAGQRIRT
ncbi:MFS transporter [Fodinibacter luteus]|uniref:MFS transporter n=1 Tax=Fodinibacter luteus TaxID=552064 RepID=A0ABP8KIJ5_9MICO